VQENHRRVPPLAHRPQEIALERRRGPTWAVILGSFGGTL
jgi:hypothetical protein